MIMRTSAIRMKESLMTVPKAASGADAHPGFFLGGGVHSLFFLNTSCIRKQPSHLREGGREGVHTPCTLPQDPSLNLVLHLFICFFVGICLSCEEVKGNTAT